MAIPANDGNELNARLSEYFGRIPYSVIVELEEDGKRINIQEY